MSYERFIIDPAAAVECAEVLVAVRALSLAESVELKRVLIALSRGVIGDVRIEAVGNAGMVIAHSAGKIPAGFICQEHPPDLWLLTMYVLEPSASDHPDSVERARALARAAQRWATGGKA